MKSLWSHLLIKWKSYADNVSGRKKKPELMQYIRLAVHRQLERWHTNREHT